MIWLMFCNCCQLVSTQGLASVPVPLSKYW